MARTTKKNNSNAKQNGATLGFEEKLWQTADKLRGHMDASEYKHVVLGLIFLKYISDAFEEIHAEIAKETGADPEDRDEYISRNIFWVPKEARWEEFQTKAKLKEIKLPDGKKGDIGGLIDAGMLAIEKENPSLKGVLPKDYARPSLDKTRLGELIDIISGIGLGDKESRSRDIIGRVYEYFLAQFASAEGKGGGEFYTPQSVVRLLVEMLEPYKGRIYDPCCGSGGMFVQSEKFVEAHGGKVGDISVYGQESNPNTWRLAKMNLAIRGIDANLGPHNADTFARDLHRDLKADFLIANPPFNDADWGGASLAEDVRWTYGTPPSSNANFAWVQHFIHHLAPGGAAGFVLADSSLSSTMTAEIAIRSEMIKANLVDCVVSLPSHLFYSTPIAVCLWFLSRSRDKLGRRDVLFIDASKLGEMVERKHRVLLDENLETIVNTYRAWKSGSSAYQDIRGFCRSVREQEVADNNFNLSPNRYVITSAQETLLNVEIADSSTRQTLAAISSDLSEVLQALLSSLDASKLNLGLNNLLKAVSSSTQLSDFSKQLCQSYVKHHFLPHQPDHEKHHTTEGWSVYKFSELFTESKEQVEDIGYCPKVFSVTNMGIQQREGKYTKELSKDSAKYKIAKYGDLVFGLSREIPNLDVFLHEEGAFSPAYHVFKPKLPAFGVVVGILMRLKLMEQTDLLKGGAREGRTLDKDKLLRKLFVLPSNDKFQELWTGA